MNKASHHIHDLKNKLAIVYVMLRYTKFGIEPSEEQILSVTERINEIIKALSRELELEETEKKQPTHFDLLELTHFMEFIVNRMKGIYPGIKIFFDENTIALPNHASILLNKDLYYQAIENAVENSKNAMANTVKIHLETNSENLIVCLCDNGMGMKKTDIPPTNIRKASGIDIIQENMKSMNGKFEYFKNHNFGMTLKLTFNVIKKELHP